MAAAVENRVEKRKSLYPVVGKTALLVYISTLPCYTQI